MVSTSWYVQTHCTTTYTLFNKHFSNVLIICCIFYAIFGEARLEPMALSEPTNCQPNREKCIRHLPKPMMQIFSLTLGKIPIERDSVELYGYMAVRDDQDLLLNYIVNRSRDEAILLQKVCICTYVTLFYGVRSFYNVKL
jgi:hypothetical protein